MMVPLRQAKRGSACCVMLFEKRLKPVRRIKKVLAALAIVCVCSQYPSSDTVVTQAASGELRFTDSSTTVGAEVEVTAKFSAPIMMDTLEATLAYDSGMLRLVSGDSATGATVRW